LRLRLRRLENHVLRHDDAPQARDVGEELAQLIVVSDDLQAVLVGVERRSRLHRERLEPADRHTAQFRLGRDVVDQCGHLVLLGYELAHHTESALYCSTLRRRSSTVPLARSVLARSMMRCRLSISTRVASICWPVGCSQ